MGTARPVHLLVWFGSALGQCTRESTLCILKSWPLLGDQANTRSVQRLADERGRSQACRAGGHTSSCEREREPSVRMGGRMSSRGPGRQTWFWGGEKGRSPTLMVKAYLTGASPPTHHPATPRGHSDQPCTTGRFHRDAQTTFTRQPGTDVSSRPHRHHHASADAEPSPLLVPLGEPFSSVAVF